MHLHNLKPYHISTAMSQKHERATMKKHLAVQCYTWWTMDNNWRARGPRTKKLKFNNVAHLTGISLHIWLHIWQRSASDSGSMKSWLVRLLGGHGVKLGLQVFNQSIGDDSTILLNSTTTQFVNILVWVLPGRPSMPVTNLKLVHPTVLTLVVEAAGEGRFTRWFGPLHGPPMVVASSSLSKG